MFRSAPAKEVIFVLPKTSKAFKNEEHFIILENEAVKSGKKVSLLCSSPEINRLAKKYKFDVLLAKEGGEKSRITAVNQVVPLVAQDDNEDEEDRSDEVEEEPEQEQKEEETIAEPAVYEEDEDEDYQVVTVSKTKRGLVDILKQDGKPLKIVLQKERPASLDVKKKTSYQNIDDIRSVWQEQSERAPRESIWTGINNRTKKSLRNFPRRSLVIIGALSVILLGTIIVIYTGSAKVDISPHKESLNIQIKVSASDKFSAIDAGQGRIPGQLFNIEKNASQTFLTSGEKDVAQKARGTITVYNEYGTAPQVLIATTRFQTPDGLIFRTLKSIIVPGTTVVGGKIVPGSLKVEVIADKPGQAYNIPASKFGIPAFSEKGDTVRYEKIYGRSDQPMKGGALGKAKVVTDLDYSTAKQTLSDQVIKDINDSLKTQTAGLKITNASAIKLKDPESTAKTDEAADSFTMSVNGSIKTVGFKEDDIKTLTKQYVEKNRGLIAIPEKLSISYDNITLDESSGIMTFTLSAKGNGYAKIDSDKIQNDLAGKNEQQIKDYFKNAPGVDSAKVLLSPFWVKKIPQNKNKTTIQINY